ncbi:TetR/AcrR family transcriptional regulator [Nocardia stercoris]|uniref:TetR/AcrR family transcriptional regulator n=1 Tax=Nocardia stercoris TaxID=2483361 RepID=A0A3M2L3Q8_9NOCA|nr:TetR/AcrR family transcriptional regulator [Nocardia stercoris]RMI31340.1 TetR/AcrR family transcriptional regulator [Nocardia stercoris]
MTEAVAATTAGGSDWRNYPPLALPPILRVTLAHIVEHGYDSTTVRTIAREVGVTVPALYYHFENKQAILVALFDHAVSIITSHIDAALAEAGDDPVRRFSLMVEALALYMALHRDLAFIDSERRALSPDNLKSYVQHRDRVEQQLRESIEAGVAAGEFRTGDPEGCGRAILSMCQGIAGWFRADGPDAAEDVARRYVAIALATVQYTGA